MNERTNRLESLLREQMTENLELEMQLHIERCNTELWRTLAIIAIVFVFMLSIVAMSLV